MHYKILKLSQLILLLGSLVVVGLSSAYLGMRFAVRGTEVEAPLIMGQSFEDAISALESLRLNIKVVGKRFDPEVSEGSIISQHPRPGGRVKVGRAVRVLVSLGEKREPVPKLTGFLLRLARLITSEAGYEIGKTSWVEVIGIPEEEVISQTPLPNTKGILNPKIDLLVSKGASLRYLMPNVIGLGLNKVMLLFKHNDVKLGRVQYRSYPEFGKGIIIKQFPEPGHMLTKEVSVNLEVSR